MPIISPSVKRTFRALRHRNYRLFFAGQGISLVGTWMQRIAMSWLIYRVTGSAFLLGLVGFLSAVPAAALAPVAGVVADRWNLHRMLIATQAAAMLQAAVLAALVLTGIILPWHIIVLSVFLGVVNAFDVPIRQSFVVHMVDRREDLANAIALNSAMFNGARLVGPSVAGLLVSAFGEGYCFLLNALSYIAVILALIAMRVKPHQPKEGRSRMWAEMKEGLRYCGGILFIRYELLLLGLVSLMSMPYTTLMPVFAKDILHGGPHTLGFLMAASGVGALIGAIYLAGRRSVTGLENWIAVGPGLFGLGLIAFSQSTVMALSLVLLFFTGFAMMVQMASNNTLLQTVVDDDKRGRVMAFYAMAFMGTAPLGNLLAGGLGARLGAPITVTLCGLACVLGSAAFTLLLPALRPTIPVPRDPTRIASDDPADLNPEENGGNDECGMRNDECEGNGDEQGQGEAGGPGDGES